MMIKADVFILKWKQYKKAVWLSGRLKGNESREAYALYESACNQADKLKRDLIKLYAEMSGTDESIAYREISRNGNQIDKLIGEVSK